MDPLLKKVLDASGISGYEKEIGELMKQELKKSCDEVSIDAFGNVIARKGKGRKKIMLASHMDEIGLLVKYITKEGFLNFIKVGGIDDRILLGQRVIVKSKHGDVFGIIGAKPPHLQKDDERRHTVKYEDLFIDIGCKNKEEAEKKVAIADPVVFNTDSGQLNGTLYYGKAIDNRVGCYALLKIMEKLHVPAEVYAVATVQEEVGLKGARTSSFKIDPDFAIAIDTTVAGDTPGIKETESALKLGQGVAITVMEAAGRGVIVSEKVREMFIEAARKNKIKFQLDVIEGGMTDGAIIYMNRAGIPTGVLSIPTRYVHAPTSVFSLDDLNATIELTRAVVARVAQEK
ncbi:MAG TPA: M42 family metallopeptidase [Candidatus Omnitrophota bacterium]|nr:M42 family metallopeptidase [Candidatus Omnitrophota bacterium]HRZ15378.1 M42 family metallopeptidase [Candidatus Omnitrophota bacterium]